MIASPRSACTEPGRQRMLLERDLVRDTSPDERAGSDQLSPRSAVRTIASSRSVSARQSEFGRPV